MIWLLLSLPFLAGVLAFAIRKSALHRVLLAGTAIAHTVMTFALWTQPYRIETAWFGVDALSLLFLTIGSLLFLAAAFHGMGYLKRADESRDVEEGFLFENAPSATFTGCLLMFLSSMTLVAVGRHMGLVWIAIETTTLTSAPLIYYHRHRRSLEATWKYLLICSVGIALALLGNFFLAASAAVGHGSTGTSLVLDSLRANAATLDPIWLKAAFILLLVGYGTKMGLAPMHTWLPDAHSEAPSMVSALLSGALLNCAFLALLRTQSVLVAAGLGDFGRDLFLTFGLLSLGFASFVLISQSDYKRMLAYSSVEHMGILGIGVGLGGVAGFGALLHATNHSLTKAALFLTAGNILARYQIKRIPEVHGLIKTVPMSGVLWLAGLAAIAGMPPFGLFVSELTILRGALNGGAYVTAILYLVFLAIAFAALSRVMIRMAYGEAPTTVPTTAEEPTSVIPPLCLLLCTLVLGLWIPQPLLDVLRDASAFLGGAQ
jgi:hydrogenase-4 component F